MYHYVVEVKMACGCHYVNFLEIRDGSPPQTGDAFSALLDTITNPELVFALAECSHQDHGEEKIDISLRVKVGSMPEEINNGED